MTDKKRGREHCGVEPVPPGVAACRREDLLFNSIGGLTRTQSADCAPFADSPEATHSASSADEQPLTRTASRLSGEPAVISRQQAPKDPSALDDHALEACEVSVSYTGTYTGTKIPTNGWFHPCRTCRSWTGSTLVVEDFEVAICKKCQLSLVRKYGSGVKRSKSLHHSGTARAASNNPDASPDSVLQ